MRLFWPLLALAILTAPLTGCLVEAGGGHQEDHRGDVQVDHQGDHHDDRAPDDWHDHR